MIQEKIKGISNYKRVILDEWSEFDSEDYKQVRKRLRGKLGQQIITTFNPIKETQLDKKRSVRYRKMARYPNVCESIRRCKYLPNLQP